MKTKYQTALFSRLLLLSFQFLFSLGSVKTRFSLKLKCKSYYEYIWNCHLYMYKIYKFIFLRTPWRREEHHDEAHLQELAALIQEEIEAQNVVNQLEEEVRM